MEEKPILILTIGLPRSGKSTWARAISKKFGFPVVNPDSVRLSLHGERFLAKAEPWVWIVTHTMVESLFLAGHETVILDSTCITKRRRDEWRSKLWQCQYYSVHAKVEDCIVRAKMVNTPDLIPVIQRMARDYEAPGEDEVEWKSGQGPYFDEIDSAP